MTAPRSTPPLAPLAVIRLALLAGVLLFGAVCWFVRRDGGMQAASPDAVATLRTAGTALWIAATVATLLIFAWTRRAASEADLRSRKIVAWAVGEAVALFGGVFWFQTGNPQWYVYGLVFFVLVLMVFPTRSTT